MKGTPGVRTATGTCPTTSITMSGFASSCPCCSVRCVPPANPSLYAGGAEQGRAGRPPRTPAWPSPGRGAVRGGARPNMAWAPASRRQPGAARGRPLFSLLNAGYWRLAADDGRPQFIHDRSSFPGHRSAPSHFFAFALFRQHGGLDERKLHPHWRRRRCRG